MGVTVGAGSFPERRVDWPSFPDSPDPKGESPAGVVPPGTPVVTSSVRIVERLGSSESIIGVFMLWLCLAAEA